MNSSTIFKGAVCHFCTISELNNWNSKMTVTSEENMRAAHPVRAYFHKEIIYSYIFFKSMR